MWRALCIVVAAWNKYILPILCVCVSFCIKTPLASNRVEAWTREVAFLMRQEGRPVAEVVGNRSTVRVMTKDWNTTDSAVKWIRQKAPALSQPFALYLGLNLPHPYPTEELGPTAGGSTFRTSPYWLRKAGCFSSQKKNKTYTWNPLGFLRAVVEWCQQTFKNADMRENLNRAGFI